MRGMMREVIEKKNSKYQMIDYTLQQEVSKIASILKINYDLLFKEPRRNNH